MTRRLLLVPILGCAALLAPALASADTYMHPANNERGVQVYPEHFKSDKTRAQVQAEAAEFVKNGGPETFRSRNYPPLDTTQASTKTRQQVIDEFMNESPAQRKARLEMLRG